MDNLLNECLKLKMELKPKLKRLNDIETAIKQEALETNQGISTLGMKTEFRKAHTRSTWDSKGLEVHSQNNPDVLKFKKVKQVEKSVVIKYSF